MLKFEVHHWYFKNRKKYKGKIIKKFSILRSIFSFLQSESLIDCILVRQFEFSFKYLQLFCVTGNTGTVNVSSIEAVCVIKEVKNMKAIAEFEISSSGKRRLSLKESSFRHYVMSTGH